MFCREFINQTPNGCGSIGFDNHGQEDSAFSWYGNSQMGRDRCRCFHLLQPIVEIHVGNTILQRVVVWIAFAFVILDLEAGGDSLLTEGDLIPSATADHEPGRQVKLISPDGFAHHLSHRHGRRMPTVPKLHHPIVVAVITNHVDIYGILDGA
jgi:hypothetical protein